MNKQRLPGKGFTLIELMLAVAIMSILAAIALPSYQSSVKKAARSEAKSALANFHADLTRYFSERNTYNGSFDASGKPRIFPAQLPTSGEPKTYNITIVSQRSGLGFLMRATPITGSVVEDDGFLQINEFGVRSWDKNGNGTINSPAEDDWQ